MNAATFLYLIAVGVGLDRLWLRRDAIAAWLDWWLDDPAPGEPVARARSHVKCLRQWEDE